MSSRLAGAVFPERYNPTPLTASFGAKSPPIISKAMFMQQIWGKSEKYKSQIQIILFIRNWEPYQKSKKYYLIGDFSTTTFPL
jgi:hypothetical protein